MSWHDEIRKREVQTVTLDSFLMERQVGPVDLVKLDIEGTEAQALRGMAVTLRRDRPSIVCEVLPGDQRGEELAALLCPLGYLFYHLTPRGPLPARDIEGHPEWLRICSRLTIRTTRADSSSTPVSLHVERSPRR